MSGPRADIPLAPYAKNAVGCLHSSIQTETSLAHWPATTSGQQPGPATRSHSRGGGHGVEPAPFYRQVFPATHGEGGFGGVGNPSNRDLGLEREMR
jgi:hypothetical protein